MIEPKQTINSRNLKSITNTCKYVSGLFDSINQIIFGVVLILIK